MQPALSRKTRRALLCIYGAALLYYIVKLCWYAVYAGATPDEVAHLSYLAALTRNPALIPDFASLPLYAELSQAGGRMVLSPAAGVNYLGHPSLYYLLMTLADAIRFQADGTVLVEILRLRIINIVLTSAAMVLVFYLGWRRLQNRRPLVHALYAAAVVTLPELGYVSSGISNDNLAFIGFVLFFAGLLRRRRLPAGRLLQADRRHDHADHAGRGAGDEHNPDKEPETDRQPVFPGDSPLLSPVPGV